MKRYLTDEEIVKYFEYLVTMGTSLNINNSSDKWICTSARKEHIDMHGIKINKGEIYYKRRIENKELKLSIQSMDEFLYLLFDNVPVLHARCEDFIKDKKKVISEAKSKRQW